MSVTLEPISAIGMEHEETNAAPQRFDTMKNREEEKIEIKIELWNSVQNI